jgi:hypothetical protein
MKTFYFLLTALLLTVMSPGYAQMQSVEKEYKGETYIIMSYPKSDLRAAASDGLIKVSVQNKSDQYILDSLRAKGLIETICRNLKEITPVADIIKSCISKEKLVYFASDNNNRIFIHFLVNMKSGKILYSNFSLSGNVVLTDKETSSTEITLNEINNLKKAFSNYCFDVSDCKFAGDFSRFNILIRFSKILADEEKEKESSQGK